MTQVRDADTDGYAAVQIGYGAIDPRKVTQPLTGHFPFPKVGPMTLLGESRANHLGKLAFRHVYWNALLPGRQEFVEPPRGGIAPAHDGGGARDRGSGRGPGQ